MLAIEPTYVKKEDGTQEEIAPNPSLCIRQEEESVYYQDGEFYKGPGEAPISYDEVPDWFWDIIRINYLESDRGRAFVGKVGLVLPEKRVLTEEERTTKTIQKATTIWKCDECGEDVPLSIKGVHIGSHRITAKRLLKEKEENIGDKHAGTKIEQSN